jgi:hypothetical protein
MLITEKCKLKYEVSNMDPNFVKNIPILKYLENKSFATRGEWVGHRCIIRRSMRLILD